MIWIAIRMLTGDRQKFFGLVFGIAFSTLLITQQLTIFVNLLERGASGVFNVDAADVWVMDRVSRTTDVNFPMPSTALDRVRSVPGVAWAVPHLRAGASVRTKEGDLEGVSVIGVDDTTLIGLPKGMVEGSRAVLEQPDTVLIDDVGATRMFAQGDSPIGERLELNDQRAVVRGIADAMPSFTAQDGIDFIIENTGIPLNFGITVVLGFVVGVAIVGLTFSLFIRDNIKQFGALKAIGVRNGKLALMVAAQAGLVGMIGYGLGVVGTVAFIWGFSSNPTFKGFYIPWQVPLLSLAAVSVIIALTGWLALRNVFKTEPAAVFR
jgi:putative ABC transport system permease protein